MRQVRWPLSKLFLSALRSIFLWWKNGKIIVSLASRLLPLTQVRGRLDPVEGKKKKTQLAVSCSYDRERPNDHLPKFCCLFTVLSHMTRTHTWMRLFTQWSYFSFYRVLWLEKNQKQMEVKSRTSIQQQIVAVFAVIKRKNTGYLNFPHNISMCKNN